MGESVDVESQEYFIGRVVKEDLNGLLEEFGDFAVRLEYRPGELSQYILCVNAGKEKTCDVKEYPITRDGGKFNLAGGNPYDGIVPMIEDIINQNQKLPTQEGVDESLTLKKGAKRPAWELKHDMVVINEEEVLGSGQFGKVCTGKFTLNGKEIKVAVKVATGEDQKVLLDTLKEARAMRNIDHPNCIKLYGIATEKEPILLVIELVNTGSLISYLRKQRDEPLPTMDRALLAIQAAWGLEYLHTKQVIHRDIAARNCLLNKPEDSEKLQVKIADFGLSRVGDKYTITKKGALPVRYMPPEAIEQGIFNSATDVWMFGALMFEVYSDGKDLFKGYKVAQVKEMVKKGEFQPIPEDFPNHAKELINACWQVDPNTRPSMKDLAHALEKYTKETVPVLADPTMDRGKKEKKDKAALSMDRALASGRVKKKKGNDGEEQPETDGKSKEKADKKGEKSGRKGGADASKRGTNSARKKKQPASGAGGGAKKGGNEASARSARGKKGGKAAGGKKK